MSDEKTCPHCAETVKAAALKCKHCGSELIPSSPLPADDEPEKKKASYGQMLGCFGVLMVVGLISAVFNSNVTETNNNIAEVDETQVDQAKEQPAPRQERIVNSEPGKVDTIGTPQKLNAAVTSPSAEFRKLCYVGPSAEKIPGVTVGEFLERGAQKGYFRNALITGVNGRYTLRFRLATETSNKLVTITFREAEAGLGCKAAHSAAPSSGRLNLETLNSGNLYVLVTMLDAIAFSDDVLPL